MLAHLIDDVAHLLRRALLVGVDRPQIQLAQPKVARQVAEGALAAYQPALLRRQGLDLLADGVDGGPDLLLVAFGIGAVRVRMGRIMLDEGVADVVHVDDAVFRRHPGMRVGLAGIGALGDRHRLDALGHDHTGHLLQPMEEALEPALQVQPVPQHQLRALGPHQVSWRGLVVVDLGAGLGDRLHVGGITGHVARHVGDDGEGGDDLEFRGRRGGIGCVCRLAAQHQARGGHAGQGQRQGAQQGTARRSARCGAGACNGRGSGAVVRTCECVSVHVVQSRD